ncbi:hypothetical protein EV131_1113 [Rhizobium laguerreae]|uniref:Transposase n=1 Tax=Rhizobium laguerreae TaxID=1076926 RepID=A0AAX2QFE9_9HYPH|nr:hypothetical protein EV131_1113 [Rhizobium laguerreae]
MRLTNCANEFAISGTTGYKIFNCYKDDGLEALTDLSCARCVAPTNYLSRSTR